MGRDKQAVKFRNKLVVSCQDNPQWTTRMALQGGCGGLRLDGPTAVKMARLMDRDIPIVACWKVTVTGYNVYITPTVNQVQPLVDAGADIVAFDATAHKRPTTVKVMVDTIHRAGAMAMADIHNVAEGMAASEAGADFISTTMNPKMDGAMLHQLSSQTDKTIVEEGGVWSPEEAKLAVEYGAALVVVGTAITRPHDITSRFVEALK